MPAVESSSHQTVLVVCFGNLCRSPMVEALLRDRLPADEWKVASAGTHAIGDAPPTGGSCNAIANLAGLDISRQLSSPLTVELLRDSDFIFTMSRRQALEAAALAPSTAARVRLLGAFAPASGALGPADPSGQPADAMEIPDPMGGDTEEYEACCARLIECADAVASWLKAGAPAVEAPSPVADWAGGPR